jgi:hypothetical protein
MLFSLVHYASAQKIKREIHLDNGAVYYLGGGYEGVAFDKSYDLSEYGFRDKRVTLSASQIVIAETLLKDQTAVVDAEKTDPFVVKNLHKYIRQYVGYIDEKGDTIVYVNCFWRKNEDSFKKLQKSKYDATDWINSFRFVLDGSHYYWNIKANINSRKLFELRVNGIS